MSPSPPLVLASTSPYRRSLLSRLRVPFETVAPGCDEVRLPDPDETVRANALLKVRAGGALRPGAAVLGSDQVAFCSGRILEKPGSFERACEQLAWLSGRDHALHTCVALREPGGRESSETVVVRLVLRRLTRAQIESYVRLESPLDCAGSYKSERLGIALFDSVECDDPTAIQGLPLIATRRLLEAAGFAILGVENEP